MAADLLSRPPRRQTSAFSLVEIVLALGIISFALVGIIGMFPVAMDAATNSQRETQAAFIAHTLFSEMSSMPGTNTFVTTSTNSYDNPGGSSGKIAINLTETKSYYVAYNADGLPIKASDAGAFSSGSGDAAFLAKITVSTNSVSPQPPLLSGLSRVDVQIDAPGAAKDDKRKSYYFAGLLNQTQNP